MTYSWQSSGGGCCVSNYSDPYGGQDGGYAEGGRGRERGGGGKVADRTATGGKEVGGVGGAHRIKLQDSVKMRIWIAKQVGP